jgi:DNA-binding GntR family transcriptional regulator
MALIQPGVSGLIGIGGGARGAVQLPSLADLAYKQVREAILGGTLAPGQPIGQEEIASQIGTSRVPLREALQRLEAEGLVVLRPRRGYVVTSLDPEDIIDIFDIRMLLEERAGYLATLRATPADVAAVRELLDAMEGMTIGNAAEAALFAERNRAFHERLFIVSGRGQLCRLMTMLRTNVERYIRIGAQIAGDLGRTRDDHHRIFEAFRKGDAEKVGRLCREHCKATCDRLLGKLRETGAASVKAIDGRAPRNGASSPRRSGSRQR